MIDDAASRLEAGEAVDLSAFHDSVESLAQVEALRTPWERGLSTSLPVLVAVVLLAPLWLLRQAHPYIEFSAEASRVVLTLKESGDLELGNFGTVNEFRIEGLDAISSDTGIIDFDGAQGGGQVVTPGPAFLGQIELRAAVSQTADESVKASLAVSRHGHLERLVARNFHTVVRADVESSTEVTATALGSTRRTNTPVMIELEGPAAPPSKVQVYFRSLELPVEFPVMRPAELDFHEIAFGRGGGVESFSSIDRASVSFVDAGRVHEFERATSLTLRELKGELRMTLAEGGVMITYQGTAGVVARGREEGGAVVDLRPSLAEWLSSDRTVALFWSGLVFAVGLMLTVRQSILR